MRRVPSETSWPRRLRCRRRREAIKVRRGSLVIRKRAEPLTPDPMMMVRVRMRRGEEERGREGMAWSLVVAAPAEVASVLVVVPVLVVPRPAE